MLSRRPGTCGERASPAADREQCVRDVELAGQRQVHLDLAGGRDEPEGARPGTQADAASAHGRIGREPDGELRTALRGEAPPVGVVHVDHARPGGRFRHEPFFDAEVLLHGAVVVEMILAEVAVDAVQVDGVGGDLHGHAVQPGVGHAREQLLQVARLGCRAPGRLGDAVEARLDRADEAGTPPGRPQDRLEEVRGRGLAVGARHSDDLQTLGRHPEQSRGRQSERHAHIRHDRLGDLHPIETPAHHERRRTARHRVGGELMPVRHQARNTEEDVARPHGIGAVGDA
jgi:hypothetical protein